MSSTPITRFEPGLICDFCNDPKITRDFHCKSFPFVVGIFNWGSNGDWAACDECAALIDADKWDALADRAVAGNPSLENSVTLAILATGSGLKSLLLELHRAFNANRIIRVVH
jgi:hypothetical protein